MNEDKQHATLGEIGDTIADRVLRSFGPLSLRDYFAGQVLGNLDYTGTARQAAHTAYAIADAMLEERGEKLTA